MTEEKRNKIVDAKDIINKEPRKPPTVSIRINVWNRNEDSNLYKTFQGCDEKGVYKKSFQEAIDEAIDFLTKLRGKI